MATIREVSEKIRDHLTQQRARATFESTGGSCCYRAPNGNKCAVGCLIPDGQYDPEFEGAVIHRPFDHEDKRAYIIRQVLSEAYGIDFEQADNVGVLRDWQQYHDSGDYPCWIMYDAGYPGDYASPAQWHEQIMQRYGVA